MLYSAPDSTYRTARQLRDMASEEEWNRLYISSTRLLGRVAALHANFQEAATYYWHALEKAQASGLRLEAARCRLRLATAYRKLGQTQDAMEFSKAALRSFEELEHPNWMREALNELALTYRARGQVNKAQYVYKRVITEGLQSGDTLHIAEGYNQLGQIYLEKGEARQALQNQERAYELYQKMGNQRGLMQVALDKGKAFRKSELCDSAEMLFQQSLRIAQQHDFPDGKQQALHQLYTLARSQGAYTQAFQYLDRYYAVRDSLSYIQQRNKVAELEAKYEERQRKKARKIEQGLLTVLLIGFVIVLGLAILFYRNNIKTKQAKALLEAKRKEVLHQNERLRELNKEKDGIIGVVAHDLKSPLNKVEGFTQLIPLVGSLNEEQESYIEQINKVTHSGKSLIRDLLDISDIENSGSKLNITAFDLQETVQGLVETFEQRAKQKDIRLHYTHTSAEAQVSTDRSFVERILDNLLSNAIKFSEAESVVRVRTEADKNRLTLEVSDQGPGISEADQQKMFKKFERLSAKPTAGESSTGLGLSIIKALVEKLGGEIRVASALEEGTTFTVVLPQAKLASNQ